MEFANEDSLKFLCSQIRSLDPLIRFVGLANGMGTLLATSYRENLSPLMNDDETKLYAMQAVLRAELREDFQKKIGSLIYSVGKYEKLIRATIPINLPKKNKNYLLISFDINPNTVFLIENKVLKYVNLFVEKD